MRKLALHHRALLWALTLLLLLSALPSCSLLDSDPAYVSAPIVQFNESTGIFMVFFSVLNKSNKQISADLQIEVTLKDIFDNELYSATSDIASDTFDLYYVGNVSRLGTDLEIPLSALTAGESPTGTLAYRVTFSDGGIIEGTAPVNRGLPIRVFEALTYTGKGPSVIEDIDLPYGRYTVTVTHDGEHTFVAELNDTEIVKGRGVLEETYRIFPRDDAFNRGGAPLRDAVLEIVAGDGNWTVTIEETPD